jgi:hypothetical protein
VLTAEKNFLVGVAEFVTTNGNGTENITDELGTRSINIIINNSEGNARIFRENALRRNSEISLLL